MKKETKEIELAIFAFIVLGITSDGKEFTENSAHKLTVREGHEAEDLAAYAESVAKNHYPEEDADDVEETSKGFEFFGGETIVCVNSAKPVTEAEYEVLNKYVNVY